MLEIAPNSISNTNRDGAESTFITFISGLLDWAKNLLTM
jgi:hypothetical protein